MKTSHVVVAGRGEVRIGDAEIPELHPNDALMQVDIAGVCGTDVHLVYDEHPMAGKDNPYPFFLGHEFVGHLVELGRNFPRVDAFGEALKEDDRVVIYPATWSCGHCYACRILLAPNLCLRPPFPRQLPAIGGGFARHYYIPEGSVVYRIPEEIPNEVAVLIEPLAGASRSLERAYRPGSPDRSEGFGPGKTLAIQGAGTIGAMLTVLGRLAGADRVIVIGAPASRLKTCRDLGADAVIDIETHTEHRERAEAVRELTPHRLGPDVVIEAAGVPQALNEAIDLVRPGGTVVEFGAYTNRGEAAVNPNSICLKDIQILGSHGYGPQQFGTALRILRAYNGRVHFSDMVTHRFPLTRVADALELARRGESMKAVLLP